MKSRVLKEVRRILSTRDLGAGDAGGFLIFCMIFLVVVAFIIQINTAIRQVEYVNDSLSKGASIAMKGALLDNYRKDYIARIDTAAARDYFYEYAEENMHTTRSGSMYQFLDANGDVMYYFTIATLVLDEGGSAAEPNELPTIEATGIIHIPVFILQSITGGMSFDVPYKVTATTQRNMMTCYLQKTLQIISESVITQLVD